MGIIYEVEESTFAGFIEDGEIFNARLVSIELKEKPFKDDDGVPVKKFEFKFKIMAEGPHDGQFIWGETGTKINSHPENRFRQWAEALSGQRLPPHYRGNTDDLVDRDCRVIIGKTVKDLPGGGEKIRNFVREIHPTRENATKLAADDRDEPF